MFVRRSAVSLVARSAVAVALAATGLVFYSSTASSASSGLTLTIAVPNSNTSLNPTAALSTWPFEIFSEAAYTPLIVQSPSGVYGPGLATKFGYVNNSPKTFSMTLRSGVKFSDGSPLTAAGVKAWFLYAAATPGPFQGVFKSVGTVDVTGKLTLTVHLKAPDPNLEYNLSQNQDGFVISPAALKHPTVLNSGTYGAGPYMLDKSATVFGTEFTYVKNPHYWNKKGQYWNKVVLTVVSNQNAALSAVESGQDMLTTVNAQLAGSVSGQKVTAVPAFFDGLTILDRGGVVVPALANPLVRQAMNDAVDRQAITTTLFGKYGQPNDQGMVAGLQSYVPSLSNAYTYSPTMAKQLLTEAGYPNGFTLPMAVIPFGGQESEMAQAVAGYLEAVGITVNLTTYPSVASAFTAVNAKTVAVIPDTTFNIQEIDLVALGQLLPGLSVINPFTEVPETPFVDLYNKAESTVGKAHTAALQALQTYIVRNAFYVNTSVADIIYVSSKSLASLQVTGANPILTFTNIKPAG
jgi:peptide/nickel transport system substrate-binding protein